MTICDLCKKDEHRPIIKRTTSMGNDGIRSDFMLEIMDICAKCSGDLKKEGFKKIFKDTLGL